MTENAIIRTLSVIALMLVTGFTWFSARLACLQKKGIEKDSAKKQAGLEARKASMVAAFFYMLFMVSLAGLFLK